MKYSNYYSNFLFSVFFLLSLVSYSQSNKKTDTSIGSLKEVAREIMVNTNTCALISVDSLNRPRVRMMGTLIPDEDFTVWFGTNPNSRKVTQIQQNPEVALYYIEEGNSGYVMLQGTAQLINSTKEKEIHWKDDWKPFYPNYPEDYILIKVTPNWMEVVSYKHNIVSKSRNWEPPKIVFD